MNARTFDKKATAGVTGYLMRHELKPNDLRIRSIRWGRAFRFMFFHRDRLVHTARGRDGMLRWMRESRPDDCIGMQVEIGGAK